MQEGKGRKMAILPMNKDLRKALAAYLEVRNSNNEEAFFLSKRGTRLTDRGIQFQFRNYFDQISLPDKTIHSLRHSFTKNLLDAGTELTVVAELSRHESLETTRTYLTPGEKDLRYAVDRISTETEFI
nr:tyrosine-type recombinase/integrase [Syntrophomonas palmitatica]